MKKKQSQPDASDVPFLASSTDDESDGPRDGGADVGGARADALLVERCVAGEVAAWEQLYAERHEPLLVSIRIMLGRMSSDANLVDEIAARVWYALVANDGELLVRFDPERGARLGTFLRALAKNEIARHFPHPEIRRRQRELEALREKPQYQVRDPDYPINPLAEFLDTLTPHERTFCSDYLLAETSGAADQEHCSTANVWQLSHRIFRKLRRFLDAGR